MTTSQHFKVDRFGPLNLRDDPGELGFDASVDLLNVDFDRRGRLRTRDGYEQISDNLGGTTDANVISLFSHASNNTLLAAATTALGYVMVPVFSDGSLHVAATLFASTAAPATVPSATSFGTPSSSRTYFTAWSSSGNYGIRYYDGSTTGSGTGNPAFVAAVGGGGALRPEGADIAPRLAQGNYSTAADDPTSDNVGTRSTVFFSDPGAPDTYTAGNFVHLRPGDGEQITAMVAWNGDLYVFKQSACFVFTHESLDPTGGPVFHYSEVTLPVPVSTAVGTARRYAVAGDEGVYFSTVSGIYRFADTPVLVSGQISELFGVDSEFSSLRFDGNPPVLSYANGRLFATYTLSTGGIRTLVYNPKMDYWTLWSNVGTTGFFVTFPPLSFGTPDVGDFQERVLFPSGEEIFYTDPDLTTDNGSNISWHWQSGWTDYGVPDRRKTVGRYAELWGAGSPTVSMFTDYGSTDSLAAAVTLGTAPAVARGYNRTNRLGVFHSLRLSGTSPASVNAIVMPVDVAGS